MRHLKICSLLIPLLILTSSCRSDDPVALEDLDGTRWSLVALGGDASLPEGTGITLAFKDGRITDSGGCNGYFASVESPSPGMLAIGPIGSTRRACPSEVMDLEGRYLTALEKVTQCELARGRLTLVWQEGGALEALLFDAERSEE